MTSVSDVDVGFEQTVFTVPEDVGSVELCVVVTNPPDGTPFLTPFTLITGTQGLTAGIRRKKKEKKGTMTKFFKSWLAKYLIHGEFLYQV